MTKFNVVPKSDAQFASKMQAINNAQATNRSAFDLAAFLTAYNALDVGGIIEFIYPLKNPQRLYVRLGPCGLQRGTDYMFVSQKRGDGEFQITLTRRSAATGTMPAPKPRKPKATEAPTAS